MLQCFGYFVWPLVTGINTLVVPNTEPVIVECAQILKDRCPIRMGITHEYVRLGASVGIKWNWGVNSGHLQLTLHSG